MKYLFTIIAVIQTVLHYLGGVGILLGIVALLFRNTNRGIGLLIGGFSFIILKYVIGLLFHLFAVKIGKKDNQEKG